MVTNLEDSLERLAAETGFSGVVRVYSTATEIHATWPAVFAGRIVSTDGLAEWCDRAANVSSESRRYGLGCWPNGARSDQGVTLTVLSNTSTGAWPIARHLDELFASRGPSGKSG